MYGFLKFIFGSASVIAFVVFAISLFFWCFDIVSTTAVFLCAACLVGAIAFLTFVESADSEHDKKAKFLDQYKNHNDTMPAFLTIVKQDRLLDKVLEEWEGGRAPTFWEKLFEQSDIVDELANEYIEIAAFVTKYTKYASSKSGMPELKPLVVQEKWDAFIAQNRERIAQLQNSGLENDKFAQFYSAAKSAHEQKLANEKQVTLAQQAADFAKQTAIAAQKSANAAKQIEKNHRSQFSDFF